jgi:hypothetical protein
MRRFVPLLFVLLVACGGGYEPPTSGPPAIGNATAEDQSCSRDSECTLVADCCGCSRQGRQQAVNRERIDALESAASTDCTDAHCPVGDSEHRSCRATAARCLGGRCIPDIE